MSRLLARRSTWLPAILLRPLAAAGFKCSIAVVFGTLVVLFLLSRSSNLPPCRGPLCTATPGKHASYLDICEMADVPSLHELWNEQPRTVVAATDGHPYIWSTRNGYLFTRQPDEPGREFTSSGIDMKCACYQPNQYPRKAPFCPCGMQCLPSFNVLPKFTRPVELFHGPFPFLLTQSSVSVGHMIQFRDAYRRPQSVEVTDEFRRALPREDLPQHDRCAIVGQSAILQGSGYGKQIDSAYYDAVFRMNENAIERWGADIGNRATYWLTSGQYSVERLEKIGILQRIRATKAKYLVLMNQVSDFGQFVALQEMIPDIEMHPTHPQWWNWYAMQRLKLYPSIEDQSWEYHAMLGAHFGSMSGTMTAIIALEYCKQLDFYGFYGNLHDPSGRKLPYHYDAADGEYRGNLNFRIDFELFAEIAALSYSEHKIRIFF